MSDFEKLNEREQGTLRSFIQAVNHTAVEYPKDKCIHQLFEQQAEKTPDATAVVFEDQTLTYQQLNEQANQLAHYLRTHGVGPDVPVGVCMDRYIELLPVLLGILKAGGAYVPLDPTYPAERLSFMASDTGLSIVIAHSGLKDAFISDKIKLLLIEQEWDKLTQYPTDNPAVCTTPAHLAYIIYTSGSTGTPKGVAVPHRGIVRLVFGQEYMQFGPDRIFLQLAPVSFDASTLEIWGALLHGGQCVLYPGRIPELELLGHILVASQINALWLTSSLFNVVIDEKPEILRSVRTVLTGGEALSVPHVRKALKLLDSVELINGYGPTESTTFACCYPIPKSIPDNLKSIPIGRPIANTQVYILDSSLQPVPIGVWGELYIGGDGLARGYLNRPELTAERFIYNPFSSLPGARLYKTGDICRWMEDGNIEYLGRTDDQVKIRGFRIELGEIENALRHCPHVQQAAVIVREDIPGQKYIVGYVVLEKAGSIPPDQIQKHLAKSLPEYMIPSVIVELTQLPLTANGKIDKIRLPKPPQHDDTDGKRRLPQTSTEQMAARLWKDMLSIDEVYLEDNFFHLGGHSLKAIQTIYQIQNTLKLHIPVSLLFENPTLNLFASAIDCYCKTSDNSIDSIPVVSRDDVLPLSFAQKRMWFIQQLSPKLPVYNISWMIHMKGRLNIGALEKSLQEIIRRHEAFRTIFPIQNGQPTQFIQSDLSWNLTIENIDSDNQPALASFHTIAETRAQQMFNLEQGPLFQFTLLCTEPEEYALLLNMHHLITDGWSMGIFAQELSDLYHHYIYHTPVHLASLPVQYADYGCWQQAEIETLKKQDLDYWKEKLAGDIPEVTIPIDFPRPRIFTFHGQWKMHTLDETLYSSLKDLAQKQDTTLYTLLLSAFTILLHYYTGIENITVGSPIAGRTHKDIENIIGFFVNTTVIRASITKDLSFRDVLHQVSQLCREAQQHQNLPYDVLVELLNPPRQANRNLYFQTMLAYQDSRYWAVALPNLQCQTIEISTQTSKLDFILFCDEHHSRFDLRAEYNTALYRSETIQGVLQTFEDILSAIIYCPEISVSDIVNRIRLGDSAAKDLLSPDKTSASEVKIVSSSFQQSKDKILPQSLLEKQISQLWQEVLGVHTVYLDDHFFHLGGHSLLAAKLFYRLEERFQIDLPLGLIFEAPTVRQLAACLQKHRHEAISNTLVQIKPGRLKHGIFYLPGVGGHTLNFYHLAHVLNIPLSQYGLNLPGLNNQTTLLTSIEQMAAYFIQEIQQIQPEGPYWLCGFSMGGRIAYEMALQLTKQGHNVAFLGILGTSAPGFPKAYLWKPAHYLERFWKFCGLSLDEKIRYLQSLHRYKKNRKQQKTAQQDDWDIQEFPNYRKLYQAGLEAFIRYQTQQRYHGDIVLFREMKDFNLLDKELYNHPTFGWDQFITGQIRVHDIDCCHPNMLNQPHVEACATLLEKEILDTLHKWKL